MINKLINFSVSHRIFIFIATLIIIIAGNYSFESLNIDAVPDITNTQVQINTSIKGLVPEEIERMITFPIEYTMNGIPGVETIRSTSRYGISQVTVIFKEETTILQARQHVNERLQSIDLPDGVIPRLGPISTGLGEIFHYSLSIKKPSKDKEKNLIELMELRSLQDTFIKPRLLNVKGVTEVNTIGGHEKQYFIQPNIKMLVKYGLHFDDIENSIKSTNLNVGGGYIQQTGEQLLVRAVGLLKTFQDIENVVVKRLDDYKVIKIKDIAQVKFDKQIRTGAATLNSQDTIIATAFMLLGENSRSVSIDLLNKIKEIQKDLPHWVELNVLYNRSTMVNKTLKTVEHNLILGAALVIFFLLLLLGNFRAAIITSLVIPISLLITFILMKWQNLSGNLMSLGALDFGIIIDGAVIVIESCVYHIQKECHQLGRSLTRLEVKDIVKKATIEIRSAAGFGELIVIIAFIPLFALTGIEGKMFGPMAKTFIIALCSALILSFTLVPALAATFLSGKITDKKPYFMKIAQTLFKPILKKALLFKIPIFTLCISTIILGAILFSRLGSEFIPQLNEGDIAIQFIRPENISIESSLKLQKMSEKIIQTFPQIKNVFSRIGSGEIATDPMGVNISDTYLMLKEKSKWPKNSLIKNKKQLIHAIKEKLNLHIPGQALMFSQPIELRFNELLEGTKAEISVKVFGEDLDEMIKYSKKIVSILEDIPGSGETEAQSKGKSPMIQYIPKTEALAQLGVTARPVLNAINTAVGGKRIGYIYKGVNKYPIVTRLSEAQRKDPDIIAQLPVGISPGHTLPISKVANIEFVDTFSSISRENSQRRVAVLINPNTRDIESFVTKAKALVEKKLILKDGYYIEWGGSFKNLQNAKIRLSILVPLAMLIIIAVLYAAFKNIAQVILIFTCAPMALIGGVIALNIKGMPFSISAGVGFIALSGISILNGVVLVSYFNRLFKQGKMLDDVVQEGAMARLRPVLMTALTDIFGFLPMMYSTGLGSEVQRPLATVVVGGIVSATLLTLIVIPTLYHLFIKSMQPSIDSQE